MHFHAALQLFFRDAQEFRRCVFALFEFCGAELAIDKFSLAFAGDYTVIENFRNVRFVNDCHDNRCATEDRYAVL